MIGVLVTILSPKHFPFWPVNRQSLYDEGIQYSEILVF